MTERPPTTDPLAIWLARRAERVNEHLATCVPSESDEPALLHRAMRYSLLAGGKRLRPILTLTAGEACGAPETQLLDVACALELIHTYSLIHDDLPSMDNDDLRRGRPTSHKVFGEAIAILAGDALLTRAFQLLAEAPVPDANRAALVSAVARAAGAGRGMVGGQVLDISCEGKTVTLQQVEAIHRAKTGALLRASVVAGGLAAGASKAALDALEHFGNAIGLAFQIVDDVLDVTASSEALGKTAGKDLAAQKATFPAVLGIDEASRRARELFEEAVAALRPIGPSAKPLEDLARFVIERKG